MPLQAAPSGPVTKSNMTPPRAALGYLNPAT